MLKHRHRRGGRFCCRMRLRFRESDRRAMSEIDLIPSLCAQQFVAASWKWRRPRNRITPCSKMVAVTANSLPLLHLHPRSSRKVLSCRRRRPHRHQRPFLHPSRPPLSLPPHKSRPSPPQSFMLPRPNRLLRAPARKRAAPRRRRRRRHRHRRYCRPLPRRGQRRSQRPSPFRFCAARAPCQARHRSTMTQTICRNFLSAVTATRSRSWAAWPSVAAARPSPCLRA